MDIFKKHPQWEDVVKVCKRLRESGYTAWLAGGCVRDGLMDVLPNDFDVVTNARPKKIESFFNKTVDVGKAFGVIRVIEKSGDIEVAMFRKESGYSDGRRPDSIELALPEEDAQRRDFTVNAMFYDLFEGEIHDFAGGMTDLKNKVLRTVGIAEDRFMEDKLRILRAVRFVAQLDYKLDEATWNAVKSFSSLITQISWERILVELQKLFCSKRADRGVGLLFQSGLLAAILPEVAGGEELEALTAQILGHEKQEDVCWLILFDHITNAEAHNKVFKRLKLSNDKSKSIANSLEILTSMRIWDSLSLADKKRLAAEPEAAAAFAVLKAKNEAEDATMGNFLMMNKQLPPRLIEAFDLLKSGVPEGKEVGQLREKIYDEQLEGRIKTRGEALDWLKKQKTK